MKILVTGGAGYIGSTLVPMLLSEGHEVTVIDSLIYGQTSLLDVCWNPKFQFIRGDVRDLALLKTEVPKADAIICLAALVGAPLCAKDPQVSQAVNQDAIHEIVRLKSKSQMLLYPCTNSGYGVGEAGIFCTENTPLRPISLYGKQKVQAEDHVVSEGHGISFRLATVFGISPRMRLDLLVNDFVYRAVNDGFVVLFEPHFKRNYLHVRDAARAFMHGISHYSQMAGNAYNVGLSDANLSKQELCDLIHEVLPKFVSMVAPVGEDPDKRNYIVSNEKIEATGFKTQGDLKAGIRELVRGYSIVKRNSFANI